MKKTSLPQNRSEGRFGCWLAVAFVVLLGPSSASGQFSGGVGDLPGGIYYSNTNGVSNSGNVVVGYSRAGDRDASFVWTPGTGIVSLNDNSATGDGVAFAVSPDGRFVSGYGQSGGHNTLYRYDTQTKIQTFLGLLSGYPDFSVGYGISADGNVIAGYVGDGNGHYQPIRWTSAGGIDGLGWLPDNQNNRVGFGNAISRDGTTIVGNTKSTNSGASGNEAFRWQNGNMVGLGDLSGGPYLSTALGVSRDGSVIVGQATDSTGSLAVLWDASPNITVLDFELSIAKGVSGDGDIVVGRTLTGLRAFVWDKHHGAQDLNDVLPNEFGVRFVKDGWTLTSANAISDAGDAIVGVGQNPNGDTEGWIAHINVRQENLGSGAAYAGIHTSHLGGSGTDVDFIDGFTSAPRTYRIQTKNVTATDRSNVLPNNLVSDVATISGTSSDQYVLQFTYDSSELGFAFDIQTSVRLLWFDPNSNRWVNAVDGNNGINDQTLILEPYQSSDHNHLGFYGLDTTSGTVWAVVNHGGRFAASTGKEFTKRVFNKEIPPGRSTGLVRFEGLFDLPGAERFTATLDIDAAFQSDLKVELTYGHGFTEPGITQVLWDHEELLDQGQPTTHIKATFPVNNTPGGAADYYYFIRVLDDVPNRGGVSDAGMLNSWSITLDPADAAGDTGPTVTVKARATNGQLRDVSADVTQPLSIPFDQQSEQLSALVATAVGVPSSYRIERLGLKISEILTLDPLQPDPTHVLGLAEQHYCGFGSQPKIYRARDVKSSTSTATLEFSRPAPTPTPTVTPTAKPTPGLPTLPPGLYEVRATAWDSAGLSRTEQHYLRITRSFGLLSVTNLDRHENFCMEQCQDSNPGIDPFDVPCGTTNFNAVLNLINNSQEDSGNVRVRLFQVPGSAVLDKDFPLALPSPTPLPGASVGPVNRLIGCSAQQVAVCGVVPKPEQNGCQNGIGYQVFAVLEECTADAVQCSNLAMEDLWVPVDSIKITEGQWPGAGGFTGPGEGVNKDNNGGAGRSDPYLFDSVEIVGTPPGAVTSGTSVQYRATAVLKNSKGEAKRIEGVRGRPWTASAFTISSTGLFQAGPVPAPTPVTISATAKIRGVTKTGSTQIMVQPAGSARTQGVIAVPVASVLPSVATAAETGTASYIISISPPNSSQTTTVSYSMSGTATLGVDYTVSAPLGHVDIPAGASSATVDLTGLSDMPKEKGETATITLVQGLGYTIGSPGAATISLTNVKPAKAPKSKIGTVSLAVSSTSIGEQGNAVFTVSTTKAPAQDLTVNYIVATGPTAALLNRDYVLCGDLGKITIPAGQTSGTVTLSALANELASGSEGVTLTLVSGAGYKLSKTATANSKTVTIANLPAPTCQ